MYTFDDGGGRSLTCGPRAPRRSRAPTSSTGCTSSPSPCASGTSARSSAASAPRPGATASSGRSAPRRSGPMTRASTPRRSCCSPTLFEEVGVRGLRLRLGSLGSPETRAGYRDTLTAYLRDHEDELSEEVRGRIDLNPLRAFDADHPGTRRVMERAPRLIDVLDDADREHFTLVRDFLDDAGLSYELDTDPRARARLLHAHDLRVHVRRARRPERRRRRRPLRRPGRAARRPAHAGDRLGGRRRADAARVRRHRLPRRSSSTCTSRWARPSAAAPRSRWPARPAPPGSEPSSRAPAGRSRASSSTPTGSALATLRSWKPKGSR